MAARLECFSKDGVERFFETFVVNTGRKRSTYNKFHSFDWVCRVGSQTKVNGESAKVLRNYTESGFVSHASDRKTDACKIELSIENLTTSRLFESIQICEWITQNIVRQTKYTYSNHFADYATMLAKQHVVAQLKASTARSRIVPIVVRQRVGNSKLSDLFLGLSFQYLPVRLAGRSSPAKGS